MGQLSSDESVSYKPKSKPDSLQSALKIRTVTSHNKVVIKPKGVGAQVDGSSLFAEIASLRDSAGSSRQKMNHDMHR